MRKNRVSETIGNIDTKYVAEALAYTGKPLRHPGWMKWCAIAACIALVAVGTMIFQDGNIGDETQISTLNNGSEIKFAKADSIGTPQMDIAFETDSRSLTEAEIKTLFRELPVTGTAIFNAETGALISFDGKLDTVKLTVAAPEMMPGDTVIEGKELTSYVDGVAVSAGYFVTAANSKGEKRIIYYATFKAGESTFYVEHAGLMEKSETVKGEISAAIQKLIELGNLDLAQITK